MPWFESSHCYIKTILLTLAQMLPDNFRAKTPSQSHFPDIFELLPQFVGLQHGVTETPLQGANLLGVCSCTRCRRRRVSRQ